MAGAAKQDVESSPMNPRMNTDMCQKVKVYYLCLQHVRHVVEAYHKLRMVGAESFLLNSDHPQVQLSCLFVLALCTNCRHDGKCASGTFGIASLPVPP